MSVHLDVRSESLEKTHDSPRVVSDRVPRLTLFERKDIVEKLSPELTAAIHREIEELREEFEERIGHVERGADRRLYEMMRMNSEERLEMEKLRLEHGDRWETATGSTAASRTSLKQT